MGSISVRFRTDSIRQLDDPVSEYSMSPSGTP